MNARLRADRRLGIAFALISVAFLAAFRAGNRVGFEVPMVVRAAYLLIAIAFGIRHGLRTRGARGFARFCVAVTAVAYAGEIIGVSSGWLFGGYSYTDRLGPMLPGEIPIAIPVFWVLMIYAADDCVRLAFGRHRRRLGHAIAVGAVAASWDLMIDPIAVAYQCWVWVPTAGATVFGIPATNAPSWWLVASVATYLASPGDVPRRSDIEQWFRHLPALALFVAALNNLAATIELGFPGAGLAGGAALAPYAIAALARREWRRDARPAAAKAG